jgi:UDP-3-O-[3-hydroxymyristoyl] N-acetylglucosamine deacetylase
MVMTGLVAQHTLAAPTQFAGVGLHTGVKTSVVLRPAPVDTGLVFRRLDLPTGPVEIPALWWNAREAALCTTIAGPGNATILTIEHLMAALCGTGIDNAYIDVTGPEIPGMDGSAAPFVTKIDNAGRAAQRSPRVAIAVRKTVRVEDGLSWAEIEPCESFTVGCEIEFESPVIGRQRIECTIDPEAFKADISRARSFGFLKDVDTLRAAGRALGGSLDNVVVIDGDRVLNDGGLRYDDEFVRHKVLDAIGDLYLAGGPLLGRFSSMRPSHTLTSRLLRALFADAAAWTAIPLPASQTNLSRMNPSQANRTRSWQEQARVAFG